MHARQWLVGDFNNDGGDDLFIADHGSDFFPFPGYPNILLLNSGGSLSNNSSNVGSISVFTHGAAIGDIDNNGSLDIFMNNHQGLEDIGGATADNFIFLNNGSGVFTKSK
ncbi:MAG: FG-GAP-like repeat-containing protein [Bacteroidetes bacterium]|nr:FG-GAP-like repeat-containing protein [Bacteroidota bacterium]MDA1121953.1 FG-GAP-like repeat-containing protein [Bacteroidota bacterium]